MGEMQTAAVQRLHRGGSPVVVFVAGGVDFAPWLAPVQLIDVRDRFQLLRDAAESTEADLFSFAYDGWIVADPTSNGVGRIEALLMVGGTRWGDGTAISVPYIVEEGRGVLLQPPLPGPDGMVQQVLA